MVGQSKEDHLPKSLGQETGVGWQRDASFHENTPDGLFPWEVASLAASAENAHQAFEDPCLDTNLATLDPQNPSMWPLILMAIVCINLCRCLPLHFRHIL